jgi:hypothetical protein
LRAGGGQAQLEYWNHGIMGDLVLSNVKEGKLDSGLSVKILLTGKLINEKLLFKLNIPIFHYSMCAAKTQASKNSFNFPALAG